MASDPVVKDNQICTKKVRNTPPALGTRALAAPLSVASLCPHCVTIASLQRHHNRLTLGDDHRVFVLRRQVAGRAGQGPAVVQFGDDAGFGGQEGLDGEDLDNYEVLDLTASFNVYSGLDIYGRVENLLDEDYEEVPTYNTSGAAVYAGLRYSF